MAAVANSEESTWITWFCKARGNEFFCEVDEDYIKDKFNLTGLSEQVPHYRLALASILDEDDDEKEYDTNQSDLIGQASECLYGLIHARFVLTAQGTTQVIKKHEDGDYGTCPRVYCEGQNVIPVGLSDLPGEATVKLYCPKCFDIYNPKSRHNHLDGAYFGTGLPSMVFMDHPEFRPDMAVESFVPRLYGFQIHPLAYNIQCQAATAAGLKAQKFRMNKLQQDA